MVDLINGYLIDEALIIIPVLLILGKIIKDTTLIADKFIPVSLLILGVAFTTALLDFNVDHILQGILVAGAAVFGNQLFKQAKERD